MKTLYPDATQQDIQDFDLSACTEIQFDLFNNQSGANSNWQHKLRTSYSYIRSQQAKLTYSHYVYLRPFGEFIPILAELSSRDEFTLNMYRIHDFVSTASNLNAEITAGFIQEKHLANTTMPNVFVVMANVQSEFTFRMLTQDHQVDAYMNIHDPDANNKNQAIAKSNIRRCWHDPYSQRRISDSGLLTIESV
jgi:hypothetical protein